MSDKTAAAARLTLSHRMTGLLLFACSLAAHAGDKAAPTASAPVLEPMSTGGLLQLIFGLLVVLALIVGLAWFMRRVGRLQGGAAGSLRVLGGLSMGTRERVVLIQVGDKQLLLGVAPGRVQTLHVLDEPIRMNESSHTAGSFAANLTAALQRGKNT